MPTPKKPQDRKPKTEDVSDCFSFEHDGETYTLKRTIDHITPGFLRKNRKLDDLDAFFTILEELADDEQLAVIDGMSTPEFGQLNRDFYKHLGAQRGE